MFVFRKEALSLLGIAATAGLSIALSSCECGALDCAVVDPEVASVFPYDVSGLYEERVNCSEENMCVTDDQRQMVRVEAEPADPVRFRIFNITLGWSGIGLLCAENLNWDRSTGEITESGSWTFGPGANTYIRVSEYNYSNPSGSGSCTGSGSKVGPPGPPAAVGRCSTGAGGAGGTGGTGGGDCIPFATDVGGSGTTAVYWKEFYTCIDDFGNCSGEENTLVTLSLIQDQERIDWEIIDGPADVAGSAYSGRLCGTSFRWESQPLTAQEDGCWEFNAQGDRFNKLSFGTGFRCVGSGSKGFESTPTPTASCAEIANEGIDFSSCPSAP